jgi:hypothetical protein
MRFFWLLMFAMVLVLPKNPGCWVCDAVLTAIGEKNYQILAALLASRRD